MAEEKYISKVRISGENYVIRDKAAYALAQTAKDTANSAQTAANTANSQIGSNDGEGLRKRVKDVEDSIKRISDSTPQDLANLKSYIDAINNELADPGAAGTMISILDTLKGFDKSANVKDYIDNVRGKDGDKWPDKKTVYGVAKYADTTVKNSLIGESTDATTANTIWGAKNYALEVQSKSYYKAEIEAGSVLGSDGNIWPNQKTVYGVAKYADTTVKNSLIGASTDATTANTIWGAKNYALEVQSKSYYKAEIEAGSVLGSDGNIWPNQKTIYGVAKYTDEKIKTLSNTAFKVRRIEAGGEGILEFSTVGGQQLG